MAKPITDYKKWILNILLDKYEKSLAFKTGVCSRRIMLSVPKEAYMQDIMEQADEKHLFLTTLDQLKNQGFIDYSWVKYETGNLVDKVWLQLESLNDCYRELGRVPAAELLKNIRNLCLEYKKRLQPSSEFSGFLSDVIEYAAVRKKVKAPLTGDMGLNTKLLECLVLLDETPNQTERVFSSKHFGDSKYFERNLKSKVAAILKEIQKQTIGTEEESTDELLSDEELFIARGLYRWPEIFELSGPLVFQMDDGSAIDISPQIYGAYINSDTIKHLAAVDGSQIRRVVFIENKANYIDWQINHRIAGDLVICHGGFYSPIKGMLFKKIYEGCASASFYHWSDMDLGGFRIFNRLKTNIIPTVQPLYMDIETIKSNIDSCMAIKSEGYIQQLQALLDNPEYSMFFEVIKYMVENRIRLEQENLIG